jgi:hypothetical protein
MPQASRQGEPPRTRILVTPPAPSQYDFGALPHPTQRLVLLGVPGDPEVRNAFRSAGFVARAGMMFATRIDP